MRAGATSAAFQPIRGLCVLLALAACTPAKGGGTAFPGAEGFGANARGGRGGEVIAVTNLDDSGPGSLRACIDQQGPRTCIFRVGGVIRFTGKPPVIRNPYLTIAGQTAPGDGILLTHAGGDNGLTPLVIKNTHDVIVRHIRVRLDRRGTARGANDAFTIENSHDVILDHVSGSWALDENVNGYGQNDNITISWSIFAEGIPRHDKCALLGGNPKVPQKLSFINNLCAHNGDRNPDINFTPDSCIEVINNVIYNGGIQFAEVWETYGGSPVNIIGNYFKRGPSTKHDAAAIDRQVIGSTGTARIYEEDNFIDGKLPMNSPAAREAKVAAPVCKTTIDPVPAQKAYKNVLEGAGAFPRDGVDTRIIDEVITRTGSIRHEAPPLPPMQGALPYADSDGDGMSDAWERTRGLDPAKNDAWGDEDGNGWTNLDEFLDYAHKEALADDLLR